VEAGADVNATVPLKQYTGGCSARVPLAHQPPAGQLARQPKRVAMPQTALTACPTRPAPAQQTGVQAARHAALIRPPAPQPAPAVLHFAMASCRDEATALLIADSGADLSIAVNKPVLLGDSSAKNSLLHLAAMRGWARMAERLVAAGEGAAPALRLRCGGCRGRCGARGGPPHLAQALRLQPRSPAAGAAVALAALRAAATGVVPACHPHRPCDAPLQAPTSPCATRTACSRCTWLC
jgi:hypothetical protein